MLGMVEDRVKILAEMGQIPLAALTAKAHTLEEFQAKLEEQLQGNDISAYVPSKARLLLPPIPLIRNDGKTGDSGNWPLLMSTKAIFEKTTFENMPGPNE